MKTRVACIRLSQPAENIVNIADAFTRFSPLLTIRDDRVFFLEIGKSWRLYNEDSFLKRARVLLSRFSVQAEIGIAASIPEAILQAEKGRLPVFDQELSSLLEYWDPFRKIENSHLVLGKMIASLHEVGVVRIHEFLQIPARELPSRFGALGVLIRNRLEDPSQVGWIPWVPPEKIGEACELSSDRQCRTLDPLLFEVKALLDRIFSRLHGRARRLTSLRVLIELDRWDAPGKRAKREWKIDFLLPQGTSLGAVPILRERMARDFEKNPPGAPVIALSLDVLEHVPGYEAQSAYLASPEAENEERNAFLSYLAESIGRTKVFQSELTEERIPEKSWLRKEKKSSRKVDLTRLPKRPSTLLGKPVRVEVTNEEIWIATRIFRIREWSEVERISTYWWEKAENRDYFRLDLENGSPVWVFSDVNREFYLHGYFL